ncbi:hypothetical protein LTR66_004353 [Elasticomyces elasticus]|nr:hypothetical protein LTR66_004353 [Elasticomyces elasticus]
MSARNRPRANNNNHLEAEQQRDLWSKIRSDAKRIDAMVAKSVTISEKIIEVEKQQQALIDSGRASLAALDAELESLYRDNVKICESIQQTLSGSGDDTNFLESLKILQGLKSADEEAQPSGPRSSAMSKGRNVVAKANRKSGSAIGPEEEGDGSAAPSPRVTNQANRLMVKEGKASRSGSVPVTREVSVKVEDGTESVASSVDGAKAASGMPHPSKTPLVVDTTVFYRANSQKKHLAQADNDAEGILCKIISISGDGKHRRYEIQDVDPELDDGGKPPSPYRVSNNSLIAIPDSNEGLSDLAKGKSVLALYPDTTCFYKAEVSTPWRARDAAGSEKGYLVQLVFEGEESKDKQTPVERRHILADR